MNDSTCKSSLGKLWYKKFRHKLLVKKSILVWIEKIHPEHKYSVIVALKRFNEVILIQRYSLGCKSIETFRFKNLNKQSNHQEEIDIRMTVIKDWNRNLERC